MHGRKYQRTVIVWFLIVGVMAFAIKSGIRRVVGVDNASESRISETILRGSFSFIYPVMEYPQKEVQTTFWSGAFKSGFAGIMPFISYIEDYDTTGKYATQMENALAKDELERILQLEAEDENHVDENGNVIEAQGSADEEETVMADHVLERFRAVSGEGVLQDTKEPAAAASGYDLSMLTYDFLVNHFYIIDSTTSISAEQLDAAKLLQKDMSMKQDNSKPQILIYHTHSQEAFADSKEGDASTTIVGMGDYLAKILSETYGYDVIHNRETYDLIDGKLDRNKAYSLALDGINKILEENPSIEVVIDLHRDGIEGDKMVTQVNGKSTAKLMFFNGLSYTKKNGAISYLENPYIEDNLAFSLQLQMQAAKYYPGATRKIYLKGYRYNLHVRPKSLLVEAGCQNNTVEEERNAMEVLADLLNKVLRKK